MMSEIMEALSSGCAHHTSGVRLIAKRLTKRGKASTALTSLTWSWRTVVDPAERFVLRHDRDSPKSVGPLRAHQWLALHRLFKHAFFTYATYRGNKGEWGGKDLLLLEAHDV